ncbi:MAG TPA: phosphoenolpyruvate-utilizing N-terminal domain-containing protein, partial [Polyangia bacterium]
MRKCPGVGASPGIGIGVVHYLGGRIDVQRRRLIPDEVEPELKRFQEALRRSDEQILRVQEQIAALDGDGQHY